MIYLNTSKMSIFNFADSFKPPHRLLKLTLNTYSFLHLFCLFLCL